MINNFDRRFLLVIVSFGLLLTACTNSGQPAANTKTETNAAPPVSASPGNTAPTLKPAASKKLNACETLPNTEVEKITGETVKSAELSRVTEGTDSTAAFSQCTYTTSGGQTIEFFARRSPVPDNTPDAIRKSRDTMKGFSPKGLEDVSGIGKTAFWVGAPMNQLHVFEGENIYLYLTMRGAKAETEARTKAVELARQAIGNLSK